MATPSPSPGPPAGGVPDPGTRPTPAPAPSPGKSPPAAPTTGAKPTIIDKIIDAATGLELPSLPGADALGDATDGIRAVRAWISDRHNWTRVGWFVAGGVLFVVGAVMVGERPVSSAVSTVAAPVGRVVKSVKG